MGTIGGRKAVVPMPRAVAPLMGSAELQALYDRYRAVSGRVAPDTIATPEMAQARAALIRALLDDGWKAPDVVHERLRMDEEVLRPRPVAAS